MKFDPDAVKAIMAVHAAGVAAGMERAAQIVMETSGLIGAKSGSSIDSALATAAAAIRAEAIEGGGPE